jgi:hypothetical protein
MEQERKRPAGYVDKYTSGNTPPLIAIGKLCASKEQDNKIDEGETFSLTLATRRPPVIGVIVLEQGIKFMLHFC